jgi:hypothetical protein
MALMVAGGAIAIGGMIYGATRSGPDASMPPDQFRQAMDAQEQAHAQALVISLGGAAILAVAALTDPDPVDEGERRRLVAEYNRRLDSVGGAAAPQQADGPRLSLGAGLLPGGAIAQVGVTF